MVTHLRVHHQARRHRHRHHRHGRQLPSQRRRLLPHQHLHALVVLQRPHPARRTSLQRRHHHHLVDRMYDSLLCATVSTFLCGMGSSVLCACLRVDVRPVDVCSRLCVSVCDDRFS
jgi:hypothetical protein